MSQLADWRLREQSAVPNELLAGAVQKNQERWQHLCDCWEEITAWRLVRSLGHAASRHELSVLMGGCNADINTPLTTPTGNIHGQPLSYLIHELHSKIPIIPNFSWLKPCVAAKEHCLHWPERCGPRRTLYPESTLNQNVLHDRVDRLGIAKVMEQTCDHMFSKVKKPIHLSFDIDALIHRSHLQQAHL